MKLEKALYCGGRLSSWSLTVSRLILAIGWVIKPQGTERNFAINRDLNWQTDRAVCLSVFRLRVGFKILN